jgi:hypothetical protein
MRNQEFLFIVFMLVGLFVLTFAASATSENTYSYDFNLFGKTYTVFVVTNSDVSNITMTKSGMGIQFQASVPSGTTGFFNVTVPAILLGTDITVFQDGSPLAENLSYTKVRIGTDYLFHLEFAGGAHTFVIEASTYTPNTPTFSSPQNQSGLPSETVVSVAAVGAVATVSAAVLYALRGAIFHRTGSKPPLAGGGGGGPTTVALGSSVIVYPHPKVKLIFSQVKTAGEATVTPLLSYPAPPLGTKFLGTVFDIITTAVFTGLVTVGLIFDGGNMSEEDRKKLRVYRNDLKKDSAWEDVTSAIDTKNNIAYGATDHFSIFGVR